MPADWFGGPIEVSTVGVISGQIAGRLAAIGAGLIGCLALVVAWVRVGRDPEIGTVAAQFDSPGRARPSGRSLRQSAGLR